MGGRRQQADNLRRARVERAMAGWIRVALCLGVILFVGFHFLDTASAQANASEEQVVSASDLGDPCGSSDGHHNHAFCMSSASCPFCVVVKDSAGLDLQYEAAGAPATAAIAYTDHDILPRLPPPKLLGSA